MKTIQEIATRLRTIASEASSAESEASSLALNGQESATQCGRSSRTSGAESASERGGPASSSSTTCAPWEQALWPPSMSSAEASRVRTLALQDAALALLESAAVCGLNLPGLSEKSPPSGSSSKTSQAEPDSGSTRYVPGWKSSAMKRYRSLCRRKMSDCRICVEDFSSSPAAWPTPTVNDSKNDAGPSQFERNSLALNVCAAMWPTLRTTDEKGGGAAAAAERRAEKGTLQIRDLAVLWPTPTASRYGSSNNGCPGDGREEYATKRKLSLDSLAARWPTVVVTDAASSGRETTVGKEGNTMKAGRSLTDAMRLWRTHLAPAILRDGSAGSERAVLNPAFCVALMGFPAGWLDK